MPITSLIDNYRADRPWRTLLQLYRPERRWAALAIGIWLVKASPLWIMPIVTANIIDIMARPQVSGDRSLWINAAVGVAVIVQNVGSGLLYSIYLSRAIRNVENRLRSALVRRLQMLSIAYHGRTSTAVLQTKVLRDVESIEQLSRQLVDIGLNALVTILVALAVTAWRVPAFLPMFLLLAPLGTVIRLTMMGRLQEYNHLFRRQLEIMGAQVFGMLSMIPITRAHGVEAEEIARVEDRFGDVRHAAQLFDRHAGLFGAVAWVTFMLFNLFCLITAAWLSYHHILPLTPGEIVLLTGYFTAIVASVLQLNAMMPLITRGFDGLRSIGEVLECPDIEENLGKKPVAAVRGDFRFENVGFRFSGVEGDEKSALRDICLEVRAGEVLGVVGASGSGKSTLMSLVIGFHRPTSGRILLDGVDMNALDLRTYRRSLSIVSQETILFQGTVRENIAYGVRDVNEADLQAAVEAANAASFIRELPHGLDTALGEGGARLSGGQRQRLAIARALLRDPRVLILDEATSALEAAGEALVQQALDQLMSGRTTFIVTHRLGTLRRADRILVLEHGAVAEYGSPAELLRKPDGSYAQLQRGTILPDCALTAFSPSMPTPH